MLGGELWFVGGWWVDERGWGAVEDLGSGLCAGPEAFGVRSPGGVECGVAVLVDAVGVAVVDVGGSVHPDPGVAVVVVVGVHELAEELPGVPEGGEPVGEDGQVFHRLEQGF